VKLKNGERIPDGDFSEVIEEDFCSEYLLVPG